MIGCCFRLFFSGFVVHFCHKCLFSISVHVLFGTGFSVISRTVRCEFSEWQCLLFLQLSCVKLPLVHHWSEDLASWKPPFPSTTYHILLGLVVLLRKWILSFKCFWCRVKQMAKNKSSECPKCSSSSQKDALCLCSSTPKTSSILVVEMSQTSSMGSTEVLALPERKKERNSSRDFLSVKDVVNIKNYISTSIDMPSPNRISDLVRIP